MFTSYLPGEIPTARFHGLLLGGVAPRPIALASTISADGEVNLSPFSFFNVFGSNPPLAIVSPARRVRDNTTKHTLQNAMATGQIVINAVSYNMVQQTSLSSVEYPAGVNEFVKAGFTALPSDLVKPPRVAESPFQLECEVMQVLQSGHQGGAGNLIFCKILKIHIRTDILDEKGSIDPHLADLVGRLGGDYYVRASGNALFKVPKPVSGIGIGIDSLPPAIRFSNELTGNHLGMLGNVEQWPDFHESEQYLQSAEWKQVTELQEFPRQQSPFRQAAWLLEQNQILPAIHCLNFHYGHDRI